MDSCVPITLSILLMASLNISFLWFRAVASMLSIVKMESILLWCFLDDGIVLVTHAHLSSMISPFPKYCDWAALPHQLHTDAYFSEVLFLTFLGWIVYFIFDHFPSMSVFCLCSSSAFHAYSLYEFVPSGNLITVFSTMPSRSLMKAVDRAQSQRIPLDILFQTDAEPVISTLRIY